MKRTPTWCGPLLLAGVLIGGAGCGSDSAPHRADNSAASPVKIAFDEGSPALAGEGWSLSGTYEGILPQDHSLWTVAESGGSYKVLPPAITVDENERTWSHSSFRLMPGRWNVHIVQCDKPSHDALKVAGTLSQFPSGAQTLKSVVLNSPAIVQIPVPQEPLPEISSEDRVLFDSNSPPYDFSFRRTFGIFRDETQPEDFQDIKELSAVLPLADGNVTRALRLHYRVPGEGAYNGWWADLRGADWTAHAQDDLVLRVRFGKTGTDCTKVFKLELKTDPGERIHPVIVRAEAEHLEEQDRQGFCDVAVPIEEIVKETDLSKMVQLVLVFEEGMVDPDQGDLYLHSIRISGAGRN